MEDFNSSTLKSFNFSAEAERMQKAVDAMIEAVKKHGWDGEWYLRAYDFYGRKIGSNECDSMKILASSHSLEPILRP